MAGHVDVSVIATAPVPVVWAVATDPAQWAAGGHPARGFRAADGRARFEVSTPPDAAGRSWDFTVERVEDPVAHTVYSRRLDSPDFRYSHTWFAYTEVPGGTELRCVVDFEMEPGAVLGDAAMAAVMQAAVRTNMTKTAEQAVLAAQEGTKMSATARELVDQVWKAVDSGEIDRLDALFAADAEFSTTAGAGRGIDYIKQVFTRHKSGYPDLAHEIDGSIESGDGSAVALRIIHRATHLGVLPGPFGAIAPTGRSLEWRSADHVQAAGGLIVAWHAHFDRLGLLQQVGQLDHLAPGADTPQKESVRRVLTQAFEQGQVDVLDELLTADFVNHRTPPGISGDAAGLKQIIAMEHAGFPDLRYTVEWELQEGPWLINVAMARATHQGTIFGVAPSGRAVSWRQVHIFRMDGVRLAEHWGVSDLASLWTQIGLVSPGGR
jgi:predicted ester cyclase